MALATIIASVILGLTLMVSGILKIPNLNGFYLIILSFGVVKGKLAKLVAYSAPFIEIILGILLILNFKIRIVSLIAALMILSYTSVLCFALVKKKKMNNCGCFGTAVKVPLNWSKIVENLLLISIALFLFLA